MSVFASLGDLATGQSNSQVIMGALCHDLQEGLETHGQPQQILKGWRGLPGLAALYVQRQPAGQEAFTLPKPHGTTVSCESRPHQVLLPLAGFNLGPFPLASRNRVCNSFQYVL